MKPAAAEAAPAPKAEAAPETTPVRAEPVEAQSPTSEVSERPSTGSGRTDGERIIASPLAKRIAAEKGIDLAAVSGTGPHGRIVKADVEVRASPAPHRHLRKPRPPRLPRRRISAFRTTVEKLSGMRKTIARRLTEIEAADPAHLPHGRYPLDALLKLRGELNAALEARRREAVGQRSADQGAGQGAAARAGVQRAVCRRRAAQVQPRRYFGRGVASRAG